MQFTDNSNRTAALNLVRRGLSREFWQQVLEHELEDDATIFARMPLGPYGICVTSRYPVEVIVFVEGMQRLRKTLPCGVNVLDKDDSGKPFVFGPAAIALAETAEGDGDIPLKEIQPGIPYGRGCVFIVARFHDDISVIYHPPQQEFRCLYQMNEPSDHARALAGHLRRLLPPLEAKDDPITGETSNVNRPNITCTVTGAHNH
jgi:hypothetical protein